MKYIQDYDCQDNRHTYIFYKNRIYKQNIYITAHNFVLDIASVMCVCEHCFQPFTVWICWKCNKAVDESQSFSAYFHHIPHDGVSHRECPPKFDRNESDICFKCRKEVNLYELYTGTSGYQSWHAKCLTKAQRREKC